MAFKTQWEIKFYSQAHLNKKSVLWGIKKQTSEQSCGSNESKKWASKLSSKTEGGLKIVYYCIEQFHLEYRLGKMSFYSLQHCSKQIQKWMMIEKMKSRAFISKATIQYRVSQIPLCKCYTVEKKIWFLIPSCMIERNWKDEWFAWWTTRATRKLIRLSDSYDWLRKISKNRYLKRSLRFWSTGHFIVSFRLFNFAI